jgi:membrane protease YdiL (CAAX protease family)
MAKKYSIGILLLIISLFIVMLFSLPFIELFTDKKGINITSFFFSRIIIWFVLLMLFFYCQFVEKQKMLLQKEKNFTFFKFIGIVILVYFVTMIPSAMVNLIIKLIIKEETSKKLGQITMLIKDNYFMIFFISFTAAVTEELMFRGYIQSRLMKIYNNPYIAIGITSVFFGLMHFSYGTISNVLVPTIIGLVFGIFYHKYSNLKVLIVVHFLIDFISLLAMNSKL